MKNVFVSLQVSVKTCVCVFAILVQRCDGCGSWFLVSLSLVLFPKHVSQSQAPKKKNKGGKKKKAGKDKESKASFKRSSVKKGALKKGTTKVDKGPGDEASSTSSTYKGYDITNLPFEAHPDLTRPNLGGHSYTLTFNQATVEVLLAKQAYFVKKVNATGTGPTGQVSWGKFGGPADAFVVAKGRSGLGRYATCASLD